MRHTLSDVLVGSEGLWFVQSGKSVEGLNPDKFCCEMIKRVVPKPSRITSVTLEMISDHINFRSFPDFT